jgi:hypothetical protein
MNELDIDKLKDNSVSLAKIEIRLTKVGLMIDASKSVGHELLLSDKGRALIDDVLNRVADTIQQILEEATSGESVVLVDNRTTEEWSEVIDN